MHTIGLNFLQTKIHFSTSLPGYYDYLKSYFEPLRIQISPQEAHLKISFDWYRQPLKDHLLKIKTTQPLAEISPNILLGDHTILSIRKIDRKWKLLFEARLDQERLSLTAGLERKPWIDFFRFDLRSQDLDEWYFMITYHLIYYPLFWYLEIRKKFYLLHASTVIWKGKGIIICGLEGIGKTSLALMFLKETDATFLSDNLIFYDQKKVYPCYEAIRLHKTLDQDVWENKFDKINRGKISKNFYRPRFALADIAAAPQILLFPEFGPEFVVESLSISEAVNRAFLLSHIPAELSEYTQYRNFLDLLKLELNPGSRQHESLRELLSQTRILKVRMPKEDGLEKNFQKIINVLEES